MKSSLTVFICVLCLTTAYPQIKARVLDKTDQSPLSYVNIGVQNTSTGTVTDENGHFELRGVEEEAIIVISFIGYETKRLAAAELKEATVISLSAQSELIETIDISSSKFGEEQIFGVRNESGRGHSISFGNPQLGVELGAAIEVKKETLIKSAHFVLNHAKGDSLLFRLNIYAFRDGEVGEKILKENIYIKEKQRKGVFTIDLEPYDLILNQDVVVSLEWLKNFEGLGNELITFDTKKTRKYKGSYSRFSKTSEFKRFPYKKKYKPCIYLVGKEVEN